jgi:hypothetical protein
MIKKIALFLLLASSLFAQNIKPEMKFSSDSSYVITYTFLSDMNKSEILDIFYYYEHISNYIKKWNLESTLLRENEFTNRIELKYNYIIANLAMEIERTRDDELGRVDFEMKIYYRSSWLLPKVHKTTGGVVLEPFENSDGETSFKVHYTQATTMNKKINRVYSKIIYRETRLHFEDIYKYMNLLKAPILTDERTISQNKRESL